MLLLFLKDGSWCRHKFRNNSKIHSCGSSATSGTFQLPKKIYKKASPPHFYPIPFTPSPEPPLRLPCSLSLPVPCTATARLPLPAVVAYVFHTAAPPPSPASSEPPLPEPVAEPCFVRAPAYRSPLPSRDLTACQQPYTPPSPTLPLPHT